MPTVGTTLVAVNHLDAAEFRRWRDQAESALAAARVLAATQPAWACFCSEQAAQLAVKGLLHAAGLEAWGHDLVELESRLRAPLGDEWSGASDPALRLARHYIPTRYPDAHPGGAPAARYEHADAMAAMSDVEALIGAIDAAWAQIADAP